MTTTRQYVATNHAKYIKKFLYTLSVPDVVYTVGVNSTYTKKDSEMLETLMNNPLTHITLMALIPLLISKTITEIVQRIIEYIIVKQEMKILSRILSDKNASEERKEYAIETFRQNVCNIIEQPESRAQERYVGRLIDKCIKIAKQKA